MTGLSMTYICGPGSYWLVPGLVLKNMVLQGFPSHDCVRPDIANSFDFMVDQVRMYVCGCL